jgi:hypothetical protein
MMPEHAIPALKTTSTKFPFWETAVRRHQDGVDILAEDPGWGSWLGIMVGILHLLYIAQVSWKQITYVISRSPTSRKDINTAPRAMPVESTQGEGPCLWCTGVGHTSDRCYAKDPANLQLFPNKHWPSGEVPNPFKIRFNKKFTKEEALRMVRGLSPRTQAKYNQASMDSTPPSPPPRPVTSNSSVNKASSSTTFDKYRKEGRYNCISPVVTSGKVLAMEAHTKVGDNFTDDGSPKSPNYW